MSSHKVQNFVSLKVKMAVAALVSLVVASGVFFFIHFVGSSFMKEMYLSDNMTRKRALEAFEEFEQYVEVNNVKSWDTESIMRWCAENKFLFVSVYDGTKLLFESDGNLVKVGGSISRDVDAVNSYASDRIVRFADGAYRVNVIEYTEARFSNFVMWIGLACAFITVFSSFIYFTGRIVGKISQLSRQFESVSDNGKFSSLRYGFDDFMKELKSHFPKNV